MKRLAPIFLLAACAAPPKPGGFEIVVEGERNISESELRTAIVRDVERHAAGEPAALDDAAFRLRHVYSLKGYSRAKISVREEDRKIRVGIEEGPRLLLGMVRFEGNRAFADSELRKTRLQSVLGTPPPYSPHLLAEMKRWVIDAYSSRGFVHAAIEKVDVLVDERDSRVHLSFQIQEGPAYVLREIHGSPEPLLQHLGKPYTRGTAGEVEAKVVDHFRERGHPFARARATPKFDGNGVVLVLEVEPGPQAKVANLRVQGLKRAKESFVRDRADLETNAPYRLSAMRRAEERIRETGLFRSVRVEPGEFREGALTIDITVEEEDPGTASIRGGYGSLDGGRLGADVEYANLFGSAELVRAGGTLTQFGFRVSGEFSLPYFLGSEFRPGIDGFYEERDFTSYEARSNGAGFSLYHSIGLTAGIRYARIETVEVDEDVPPGDLLDFEYVPLSLSATWDGRDSSMLPTKGFTLDGLVEWAGQPLSRDIQYVSFSGRATAYVPLPWGLVFAASVQGGWIQPREGTDEIPIALRFFAGGTSTVRGFEFGTIGPRFDGEPTGGELYLALQMELRFPIVGDLHGAVFSDRGGVWFRGNEIDIDDTRYSIGAGLRYHTPAGAIVADVAWNVSPQDDEDPVALHISIGFPF